MRIEDIQRLVKEGFTDWETLARLMQEVGEPASAALKRKTELSKKSWGDDWK